MPTTTLSARDASVLLGVKPATLYTYVSRGWLRSLPASSGRARRYLRVEVEALRAQALASKGHAAAAVGAMGWGQPVVDTAISDVPPTGVRYRANGLEDAVDMGFEATCQLLWEGDLRPSATCVGRLAPGHADDAPLPRLAALLALDALDDPDRLGRRGAAELAAAARVLRLLAAGLAPDQTRCQAAAQAPRVADVLALALGVPAAADALDAALVVCAEHELNASTFAVRVAASTGADLASCLGAGLAALSGPRHGGASVRVDALFDVVGRPERAVGVLRTRAAEGRPVPGLGHRLYPHGDPRALILWRVASRGPHGTALADALVEALQRQGQPRPNLDFGLVCLRRAWGLPRFAAQLIFAVGRVAGWVAHLQEERGRAQLIRPRARYVGPASSAVAGDVAS